MKSSRQAGLQHAAWPPTNCMVGMLERCVRLCGWEGRWSAPAPSSQSNPNLGLPLVTLA